MRKKKKTFRQILPDPLYNDILVAKFINHLIISGKKATARRLLYSALEIIKKKTKRDPLIIFQDAVNNAMPKVEVISRRIGGARYQIPKEVSGERRTTLAIRWLIAAARKTKGASMDQKLAQELLAAQKNEGEAIRKKREIEKIAEANRAFAHLAW